MRALASLFLFTLTIIATAHSAQASTLILPHNAESAHCWLELIPPQRFVAGFKILYSQSLIDHLTNHTAESNPFAAFTRHLEKMQSIRIDDGLKTFFALDTHYRLDLTGLHVETRGLRLSPDGAKALLALVDRVTTDELLVKPISERSNSDAALEKAWLKLERDLENAHGNAETVAFDKPDWTTVQRWVVSGALEEIVLHLGLKPYQTLTQDLHGLQAALEQPPLTAIDREVLLLNKNADALYAELGRLSATVLYLEKINEGPGSQLTRAHAEHALSKAREQFAAQYVFLQAKAHLL